ncbi:MAG: phosphatidate cytidylyltransferase [bacterium]
MTRVAVGVAAGIVVVFIMAASRVLGLFLIAVCHLIAMGEYLRLAEPRLPDDIRRTLWILVSAQFAVAAAIMATYVAPSDFLFTRIAQFPECGILRLMAAIGACALLTWITIFLAVSYFMVRRHPHGDFPISAGLHVLTAIGTVYVGLLSLALLYAAGSWNIWFLPMLLSWGADAGAFFTGRSVGKSLLAPTVSPKKTVEGLTGAMLTGAVALPAFLYFSGSPLAAAGPAAALFQALAGCSIAGLGHLGDLFISILKRAHHQKESGVFLPGHGGILDKIDSLLIVSPIVALLAFALS